MLRLYWGRGGVRALCNPPCKAPSSGTGPTTRTLCTVPTAPLSCHAGILRAYRQVPLLLLAVRWALLCTLCARACVCFFCYAWCTRHAQRCCACKGTTAHNCAECGAPHRARTCAFHCVAQHMYPCACILTCMLARSHTWKASIDAQKDYEVCS